MISSQKASSRLLEGKRNISPVEIKSQSLVEDRIVSENITMDDCLQCEMVARKSSEGCKIENFSSLKSSESCTIHQTNINGLNIRNGLETKPPPALKFSVNAILARAAQAGSSSANHNMADNDSLSEDTDHLGSEGTGASSDHDNIQNSHLNNKISSDFKHNNNDDAVRSSSSPPCPNISTSMNNASAISSIAMSSHPYILGSGLTSVISGVAAGGSLAKPVPRPLGTSPLFNGGGSPLQNLLYRHPYLSTAGKPNIRFLLFIISSIKLIL